MDHPGRYIWLVILLVWILAPLLQRLVRSAGRSAAPAPSAAELMQRRLSRTTAVQRPAPPRPQRPTPPRPQPVAATAPSVQRPAQQHALTAVQRHALTPAPVPPRPPRTAGAAASGLLRTLVNPAGLLGAVVAAEVLRAPLASRRLEDR